MLNNLRGRQKCSFMYIRQLTGRANRCIHLHLLKSSMVSQFLQKMRTSLAVNLITTKFKALTPMTSLENQTTDVKPRNNVSYLRFRLRRRRRCRLHQDLKLLEGLREMLRVSRQTDIQTDRVRVQNIWPEQNRRTRWACSRRVDQREREGES